MCYYMGGEGGEKAIVQAVIAIVCTMSAVYDICLTFKKTKLDEIVATHKGKVLAKDCGESRK